MAFRDANAYNNIGISNTGATNVANLDGGHYSYSNQALQSAGLKPGQPFSANDFTFTWPNVQVGVGGFDNYQANGQSITLTLPTNGATTLAFLGTSTGGTALAQENWSMDHHHHPIH
ncbi:MAG TPA: hypothetical protein VL461_03855 [Dictyobacter sp.]|jgi:hypothetical protein|nr:hypothetical protein [Dictyobacter sp.]